MAGVKKALRLLITPTFYCAFSLLRNLSEEEFIVVFVNARASTDNLLELGHRIDAAVQHDEMTGLGVHAGGHEPGGRGDDGKSRFRIDEVIELYFAFFVVAGNAHHILVVDGGKV